MARSLVRAFGVPMDIAEAQVLLDRRSAPRLRAHLPVVAPYIDNANWIAADSSDLDRITQARADVLGSVGLKFRVEQSGVSRMDVIGLSVDLRQGWIRNTAKRTWWLYRSLRRVVRQRYISGYALRVVVGHLCHFFMVRRPALATLSAVWKFIEDSRDEVCWLPDQVVSELIVARSLLPILGHSIASEMAPAGAPRDTLCSRRSSTTTRRGRCWSTRSAGGSIHGSSRAADLGPAPKPRKQDESSLRPAT